MTKLALKPLGGFTDGGIQLQKPLESSKKKELLLKTTLKMVTKVWGATIMSSVRQNYKNSP